MKPANLSHYQAMTGQTRSADLFENIEALIENPYPHYARMRQECPIYFSQKTGSWLIGRYRDVLEVLRNHTDFSSSFKEHKPWLVHKDPPEHSRLRSLISRRFTPQFVAKYEPRIRDHANQLIDRVIGKGTFDLVQDLAAPLQMRTIAEILGVEEERIVDLKRWADDVIVLNPGANIAGEKDKARLQKSFDELRAYFFARAESSRARQGDDLVSLLVAAQEEKDALTTEEIVDLCFLLLIAGGETNINAIGNTWLALVSNPGELAKLYQDISLVNSMVEEALRYDPPAQIHFRRTTREVEVGGVRIGPNESIFAVFGSANRDPEQFPDPDRFDITRCPNEHISFGIGIHFCLGAALAKLVAVTLTCESLRRMKNVAVQPQKKPERIRSIFIRGLKSLPLVFQH